MPQTTTVNVSFSKRLLKDIDEAADAEARTRSELLREATRLYIERKRRWRSLMGSWRAAARRAGMRPSDVESAVRKARAK